MASDEATPSVDVVELDGLVVLKIIKHCHEALPGFVTGQLLGLDIGRTLEVTNCFAFPTKDDDAGGGGKGDGDDDEDGAEYQIEMMRSLREVNVDNNTVGWYQSTYFSSFIDDSCIETQFNYQENIKNCCVIIYDPSRARAAGLALRAFRLTDAFMAEYKEGKFAGDAAAAAASGSEIFQELPLKVRNSHLASALLLELQDEVGFPSTASDFSRLELHTNPFLEKQMQLLIECIDDLQQESHKMQQHERNLYRQKKQQANKTPAPPDRRRAFRDRAPRRAGIPPPRIARDTPLTPSPSAAATDGLPAQEEDRGAGARAQGRGAEARGGHVDQPALQADPGAEPPRVAAHRQPDAGVLPADQPVHGAELRQALPHAERERRRRVVRAHAGRRR